MDVIDISVAKKYTDDSLEGVGALEGKPCQIQSITDITGGHRVTFLWVDNDGVSHTSAMDVMDGVTPDFTLYQTKALETALTIGGESKTNVEDELGALNDVKADAVGVTHNCDANGIIEDNTDLNDMVTVGNYGCNSAAKAQGLTRMAAPFP